MCFLYEPLIHLVRIVLNFALCGFHLAVNHGIQYISMFCVVQMCF